MKYEVHLSNDRVVTLPDTTFNAEEFTTTLNTPSIIFVNLGGVITQKHLIQTMIPVPEIVE